jgi:hypothetical protein
MSEFIVWPAVLIMTGLALWLLITIGKACVNRWKPSEDFLTAYAELKLAEELELDFPTTERSARLSA